MTIDRKLVLLKTCAMNKGYSRRMVVQACVNIRQDIKLWDLEEGFCHW